MDFIRYAERAATLVNADLIDDVALVVSSLNVLLAEHPVTPMISDHDPDNLHMHVANRAASVAELLIGEALMGLANLVCDLGATRLGICTEPHCDHVFVDTSPNQSRRYCSDRCSSRANVAAFRARRRAEQVDRSPAGRAAAASS